MGGQNCDGCRSWVEYIYWSHFQFLQFVQILRDGYDQQLALPKTFSDNLKRKLPENVTLKGPGGVVWNIGLTTKDDSLYFMQGWCQFVKDHSLKENDFLVFKYNGESLFDVLIFDGESFCEKAGSYFVRKCGHATTELGGGRSSKRRETDNSVEEVNTPSNGGVECVSPDKSVQLNSIKVPFAVPSETTNEKTFNAGVDSACPEQFMSGVETVFTEQFMTDGVTEPASVPSQTTGKRTCKSVQLSSIKVPFAVPSETPNEKTFNVGVDSACPDQFMSGVETDFTEQFMTDGVTEPASVPSQTTGKRTSNSVQLSSIKVPFAVPSEAPNEKTFTVGVDSACPEQFIPGVDTVFTEQFMTDGVTELASVPSLTTGKRTSNTVYGGHVLKKRRGRPPKASKPRQKALNLVTGDILT